MHFFALTTTESPLQARMLQYRQRNGTRACHLCSAGADCADCAGSGIKPLSFQAAAERLPCSKTSWQTWEADGSPSPVYRRALLTLLAADERRHRKRQEEELQRACREHARSV